MIANSSYLDSVVKLKPSGTAVDIVRIIMDLLATEDYNRISEEMQAYIMYTVTNEHILYNEFPGAERDQRDRFLTAVYGVAAGG